jgi:hypothetical protein
MSESWLITSSKETFAILNDRMRDCREKSWSFEKLRQRGQCVVVDMRTE